MKAQKALSIRQPYAWLIANGIKRIENRTWSTKLRGRIFIHASQKVEKGDYQELIRRGVKLPPLAELRSGGLVGEADLVDCVETSDDKWFEGPFGLVLKNAKVIPFVPCKGALHFFEPRRT